MKQHQVFGPFYPVALQSAVNHAERFCGVLADFEARPPSEDEQFLAWLSGREGEVRQVVENVVTDWDGNLQTADGWGMKIEEYLRVLHEALVRFGAVTLETGVPMCCAAPLAWVPPASPRPRRCYPHPLRAAFALAPLQAKQ